jgi:hypothetical protein
MNQPVGETLLSCMLTPNVASRGAEGVRCLALLIVLPNLISRSANDVMK